MYKKVWYPAVLLMLGAAMNADAGQLYRYINDNGVTVLDRSVPPQFVGRGYEVLDMDGRVKEVIPAALSPAERQAQRAAEQEQRRRWYLGQHGRRSHKDEEQRAPHGAPAGSPVRRRSLSASCVSAGPAGS